MDKRNLRIVVSLLILSILFYIMGIILMNERFAIVSFFILFLLLGFVLGHNTKEYKRIEKHHLSTLPEAKRHNSRKTQSACSSCEVLMGYDKEHIKECECRCHKAD